MSPFYRQPQPPRITIHGIIVIVCAGLIAGYIACVLGNWL